MTNGDGSAEYAFHWRLLSAVVIALASSAAPLRAQSRQVVVDVTVIDSSGARINGVELALRRLGSPDVWNGTTDQRGLHHFGVPDDTGALSLVSRKIGYAPVAQEFRADRGKSNAITVILARAAITLDTARVVADIPRSKQYFIGADDIKKSTRYIQDALDAISKIHPAMLGDGYRLCPGVSAVWINGARALTPWGAGEMPRNPNRVSAAGVRERPVESSGNLRDRLNDLGPPNLPQILASIHANHISEIRYVNCWDSSMPGIGGQNALYIVLWPGVSWDLKRGSRVVDSALFKDRP